MRRSLILVVAASVTMVLLAMLVPMAVLVRGYAVEDRLSRAALEVQATETVVSGQDKGAVATYLDRINRGDAAQTTVLYPPSRHHPRGEAIGPSPDEDGHVALARRTGRASVRDIDGGAEILVPVSLGGSSAAATDTPVIRVEVRSPGAESAIVRSWLILVGLGVVLLAGALVLADRLGRSFVQPIRGLAAYATTLGSRRRPEPIAPSGPVEVRDLASAMNRLVGRIEALLERERAGIADVSHRLRTPMTALRLRIDAVTDQDTRDRLGADLDDLQATVDHVVREARRSEREGLVPGTEVVAVVTERVRFWAALAEDQGRSLELDIRVAAPAVAATSEADLQAAVDVLLDNVFTHTPDDAPVLVRLDEGAGGGVAITVDDGGPGFPDGVDVAGRGRSTAGSTGLGLSIVAATAEESGGRLTLAASPLGGARVVLGLGPPA